MTGRRTLFIFCCLILGFLRPAAAHDIAESTVVARLQHNRLEVVVTMTPELASALIAENADPETAPKLTVDRFGMYRERLQEKALDLYDVTAGDTPMIAQRAAASIIEGGHVQLVLFYPEPTEWPLRFHARTFENAPGYYTSSMEVFDQDEKLLGRKLLAPQYSAIADLSIDPNASPAPTPTPPPTPTPTLAPTVQPVAPAPASRGSWSALEIGAALGLAGWLAVFLLRKAGKSSPQ